MVDVTKCLKMMACWLCMSSVLVPPWILIQAKGLISVLLNKGEFNICFTLPVKVSVILIAFKSSNLWVYLMVSGLTTDFSFFTLLKWVNCLICLGNGSHVHLLENLGSMLYYQLKRLLWDYSFSSSLNSLHSHLKHSFCFLQKISTLHRGLCMDILTPLTASVEYRNIAWYTFQ